MLCAVRQMFFTFEYVTGISERRECFFKLENVKVLDLFN